MCEFLNETIDLFIDTSKKYWNSEILFKLSLINNIWYEKLIENTDLLQLEKFKYDIENIIKQKDEIYDQFTYQRTILKKIYSELQPLYDKLKITVIDKNYADDDLDDIVEVYMIYCASEKNLPFEIQMFFQIYIQYPEPKINVFYPEFIDKFLSFNKKELNGLNLYSSNKPKYDNMLFLIPICYSKHYKQNYRDLSYVNILCYINIVDDRISDLVKNKNDQYLVLHLPFTQLDNNPLILAEIEHYINKIHISLRTSDSRLKIKEFYYYQDILNMTRNFTVCLQQLLKDYRSY